MTATELRFLTETERYGARELHPDTLLRQIGRPTIAAVSGGRVVCHQTPGRFLAQTTGAVQLPVSGGRSVQITLNAADYYTVRRLREVFRGANRGQYVVEHEADDVDCTQVSDAVYAASCWK